MRCLIVSSQSTAFGEYSYYQDWQAGFMGHPKLKCDLLDIQSARSLRQNALLRRRYDLIVFLHNTFITLRDSTRLRLLRWLLAGVRGERVFFLSNEFRALKDNCQMADYLGAGTLVSQLNSDDAAILYQSLWSKRILSLPYGYNPNIFKPEKLPAERRIDIGFRGDYYPIYVGHDDRDLLLDAFNERVKAFPHVRTDIQVGQRLDHHGWAAFLNDCRSLIGHEAGAARLDADENIRHFLNAQHERLAPDQLRKLILTMREVGVFDPPPSGRIAAPRNFEAMGTKTVQILLPGRYNDMLEAGVHYIELQRDFGNLEQVLETLFDESAYTKIAERAYADALASHTYTARVETLLDHILG